jgi:hypothetical protein
MGWRQGSEGRCQNGHRLTPDIGYVHDEDVYSTISAVTDAVRPVAQGADAVGGFSVGMEPRHRFVAASFGDPDQEHHSVTARVSPKIGHPQDRVGDGHGFSPGRVDDAQLCRTTRIRAKESDQAAVR